MSSNRTLNRRDFLRSSAVVGAASAVTLAASGQSATPRDQQRTPLPGDGTVDPLKHSIASGDPTSSSVILWTRVTQMDEDGQLIAGDVPVLWSVYSDPERTQRVSTGQTMALAANDYCVKVDAQGLNPYTAYYYQFSALGFDSPVGRAQTLPDWDADTDNRLRIAVVSCSNYPHGYFHVYKEIADRNDIDLIVHLGDYIYEYGNGEYGDTREVDPPGEMLTLDDYRRRHALHKAEPDLSELHRQFTWVTVWDDHETTDNSRKCTANNHTEGPIEEGGEGVWYERKSFGIQAYFEWMPIRPAEDDVITQGQLFNPSLGKTWRKYSAGQFADIIMIDTRLWGRDDESEAGAAFQREAVRDYMSPDPLCGDTTAHRDILGPDQEAWLHEQLRSSPAKWKIIGNQLILSQLRVTPGALAVPPTYLNTDAWDGYPTSQERLYEVLQGHHPDGSDNPDAGPVDNVVVITGDIHTSWAFDVTPNPDALPSYDPVAVEFVGPSVTSPGLPIPGEVANAISVSNLHLKYVNLDQKGWVLLDLAPDYATGEWYHIGPDAVVDAEERPEPSTLARVYRTPSTPGDNGIEIDLTDPTGRSHQTDPGQAYLDGRPPKAP